MLMRSPLARDRRRPPGFIRPALPVLATRVPAGDGWIHELKHDGFRMVAVRDGDDVRLWSRNGRNWSADFLACRLGLEGIVSKRGTSRYRSDRCLGWVKENPEYERR